MGRIPSPRSITFALDADAADQQIIVEDYEYVGTFSLDPDNPDYRHFPNFGTPAGAALGVAVTHGTLTVESSIP